MSEAHHRKKQPDVVRRLLLDKAAALAVEQGLTGLTLDAVARAAGVSKGGLLHHFPSKHALLEALCDEFLQRLDRRITQAMKRDKAKNGRFARAYLDAIANRDWMAGNGQWAVLSVMLFSEAAWRKRWHDWVQARLLENRATDSTLSAWIVRLAADGLWLSDLVEGEHNRPKLRKAVVKELRLLATRPALTSDAPVKLKRKIKAVDTSSNHGIADDAALSHIRHTEPDTSRSAVHHA